MPRALFASLCLAFVALLLGACADPASESTTCASGCDTPPADVCVNAQTLRLYDPVGACQGEACAYVWEDRRCVAGCADGACLGGDNVCDGVVCDEPPSTCQLANGTCEQGACIYPAGPDGVACLDQDMCVSEGTCQQGTCRPSGGFDCTVPPPNECLDYRTVRAWSGGSCTDLGCAYTPTDTVCVGEGCAAGRCTGEAKGFTDRSTALGYNNSSSVDVRIVDLDGDGKNDLVWTNQDPPDGVVGDPGGLLVQLGQGDGTFRQPTAPPPADLGSWTFLLPLDVDRDGDLDLVLTRPAGSKPQIAILVNGGNADFVWAKWAVPDVFGEVDGLVFGRAAAGDLDGDGDPDLVLPVSFTYPDFATSRPSILLLNEGLGTFVRDTEGRLPTLLPDDDWTISAAIGDLTGDGHADVWLGQSERQQRLFVNDGTGHFTDQSVDDGHGAVRVPPDPLRGYHTELTDLDADGDLDVVVANDVIGEAEAQHNVAFFNDGTGHFTAQVLPTLDGQPHDSRGVAFGDVDLNGVLDILIGNGNDSIAHGGLAIEVLLGQGDGAFVPMQGVPTFQKGVFGIAWGDLDSDGYPDIAGAVAEAPDNDLANLLLLTN